MIKETSLSYYESLASDQHHRYKSWEHAYLFFKENHRRLEDEKIKDHASLHLAFYLASWGMMRGGSFLLQKDYKIHTYFIERVVANPKYWVFYSNEMLDKEEHIALVEELIKETAKVYREAVTEVNGEKKSVEITDTLVTKILLGVYGNVPAYDRYFKAAVKEHGITAALGRTSLSQLFDFYNEHEQDFISVGEQLSGEITYPIMKLIDMYFFNFGLQADKSVLADQNDRRKLEFAMSNVRATSEREPATQEIKSRDTIIQSVRDFILVKLAEEKATGVAFVDLQSGEIHRQMNLKSRLPTVCQAMLSIPSYHIEVLHQTKSGYSSTNVVRYFFD